jgi:hypothetical protein
MRNNTTCLFRVSLLRSETTEWVEPDGQSPMCDFYDARLAALLGLTRLAEEVE